MSAIATFPGATSLISTERTTLRDARRRGARAREEANATGFVLSLLGASLLAAAIGAGAAVASAGPMPTNAADTTPVGADTVDPMATR